MQQKGFNCYRGCRVGGSPAYGRASRIRQVKNLYLPLTCFSKVFCRVKPATLQYGRLCYTWIL